MHLAILMANTDDSEFAQSHPKDGDKWIDLLSPFCGECRFSVYSVKDGEFPDDPTAFDGLIVTGSPASVNDPDPWLAKLFDLIRDCVAVKVPLFGACFGHQAIAKALGSDVVFNPNGWVFGTTATQIINLQPWMSGPEQATLHAAHVEQVAMLPPDAKCIMGNDDCPIGGFAIADRVFTTQYHPEITAEFMLALIEELAGEKSEDVIGTARRSMTKRTENARFAVWIVEFFRRSTPQHAPSMSMD